MHAMVLAGGRGVRMGALTDQRQKVCLRFRGIPLIVSVLKSSIPRRGLPSYSIKLPKKSAAHLS